ncbi:MAG: hypothetical protein JHD16_17530 [Solirubrobacteraceae bacterium]|nr:hypothetical protein [Solirubrobacteraceae bacterium]
MDHIEDLCRRMEDLCANGGIPRFDRVRWVSEPGEVWFIWDPDRVVAVPLRSTAESLVDALASAPTSDPAFN